MMKEKFARTIRFRIGPVAMAVGGNVEGVKPGFTIFNTTIGVGQVTASGADGFDFGTGQDDAGFNRFGNGVVMTGFTVLDFDRFQGA